MTLIQADNETGTFLRHFSEILVFSWRTEVGREKGCRLSRIVVVVEKKFVKSNRIRWVREWADWVAESGLVRWGLFSVGFCASVSVGEG